MIENTKEIVYQNQVNEYIALSSETPHMCDIPVGIKHYYWCLGSQSGYCDVTSYTETTEPEGSQGDLHLTDGHPVYVSVQVSVLISHFL